MFRFDFQNDDAIRNEAYLIVGHVQDLQIRQLHDEKFEMIHVVDFVVIQVQRFQIGYIIGNDLNGGYHDGWSKEAAKCVTQQFIRMEFSQIQRLGER